MKHTHRGVLTAYSATLLLSSFLGIQGCIHDPLRWHRPAELHAACVNGQTRLFSAEGLQRALAQPDTYQGACQPPQKVCHEGITYKFEHLLAKRHLIWHTGDYPGDCREKT